jgi:hypothetical protein
VVAGLGFVNSPAARNWLMSTAKLPLALHYHHQAQHMADSIQGDGLLRGDRALEALVGSLERLERAKVQFSRSSVS